MADAHETALAVAGADPVFPDLAGDWPTVSLEAVVRETHPVLLGAGKLLGTHSKTSNAARTILGELVTLNTFRARAPDPQ